MKRPALALLFALVVVHAPLGCHDDHEHGATGPTDATYQGAATDEGLAAFEAATKTTDASKAPVLLTPAADASVPSTPAVTFTWKATPTASHGRRAGSRYAGASPLGPLRFAHAHGDPMNGRAYLLTFSAGGEMLARVFTTETSYTPDDATWTKLKGRRVDAVLASASFDQNNVVPGSGPFVAPAVAFTVAP